MPIISAPTAIDGRGRVYAVWRYVPRSSLLDGPGCRAPGILTYRCLEGGNWSKRILIGDKDMPSFSWFITLDPE